MKKLKLFSWCKQSIQFLVIRGGLICNREFDTSKTEKNITVVCIIRKKTKTFFTMFIGSLHYLEPQLNKTKL